VIVGLNSTHTQGQSSLEVSAQNFARLNSVPMSSIGSVGPIVLIDVMLPTDQANPSSYGDVQMYVNSPSMSMFNVYLGDVGLTGLPLAQWETLAFQMPAATAATIADSTYSDLTFSVVLNVPSNENGHYLLDNIRSVADVTPALLGIAQDGSATKAIFTYTTTSTESVDIPYGRANSLADQNGFITSPIETPPTTFVSETHAPFVATLAGPQLTWTLGSHSATATAQSNQLQVQTLPDGTHDALLPDGRKVNLDSVPPPDPTPAAEPTVAGIYKGTVAGSLTVGPTGAAIYTVPIATPPGVAGMAPNLSLVYDSQGGDGIAGQGWELSGLSMIHRCPKTRVQDGIARPIQMDDMSNPNNTDGICLDGQRLFEDPPGSGSYRPEKQDFSQIVKTADGYFQVTLKSGETRFYGLNPNYRVAASNGGALNATAIWLLDRAVDAWGNYFDVQYNETNTDFTTSGIRVSEIDYTGHLTSSGAIDVQPFSWVKFAYDPQPRPDVRWIRFGSTRFPKNRRLQSITTPRGTYTLDYFGGANPTLPSQLKSIGYCTGAICEEPLQFTWQGGGYDWAPASGYALPSAFVDNGTGLSGTQFVDVDGDGLLDFVLARPTANGIWRNNGQAWEPLGGAANTLPVNLSDQNGFPTGARFADLDGDGVNDLIEDQADVTVNGQTKHYQPAVWLNKIRQAGGWEFHPEYGDVPASSPFAGAGFLNFNQTLEGPVLADVDGDGRTDLIQVSYVIDPGGSFADTFILLNKFPESGWVPQRVSPHASALFSAAEAQGYSPFQLRDINRDGLPDIVSELYAVSPSGSISTAEYVLINQGPSQDRTNCDDDGAPAGSICFAPPVSEGSTSGDTPLLTLQHPPQFGDIDGDGFYDVVLYYPSSKDTLITDPTAYLASVGMGDGTGMGFESSGAPDYLNSLKMFSPTLAPGDSEVPTDDFDYELADLNGDGLVDLVRNHVFVPSGPDANPGGGEVLFNDGMSWRDPNGITGWQLPPGTPAVPAALPIQNTIFIDLNGDGITDVLGSTASTPAGRGAWLNTFKAPMITDFPNGLARPTHVEYHSITEGGGDAVSNGFYMDDNPVDPGTKLLAIPLQVVTTVTAEDGTGTHALTATGYVYHSMRISPDGRGPLGFRQVEIRDPAAATLTFTTYAQAYPYTGLVTDVLRFQLVPFNSLLASDTATEYCDSNNLDSAGAPVCSPAGTTYPARSSLFVHPTKVTDAANPTPQDESFPRTITTITGFQYDDLGNPTQTTVSATKVGGGSPDNYSSVTNNTYGAAGSQEERQGKLTQTLVTVTNANGSVPHTTTSEYAPVTTFGGQSATALALIKKRVEPSGWPLEIDTAYAYDRFGNVITTTSCANDFDSCSPLATGPVNSPDPVHHAPFRTTRVSYDPADFNAPVGSGLTPALSYGVGRFPVRMTNAAGHTELTAYDPVKGLLIQKTGPNGINTCFTYDDLGRQTAEIARCGSEAPMVSTTGYFLASSVDVEGGGTVTGWPGPPNSQVVTVHRPPTGATTWTYVDDQGKTTGTLARSFTGGFVETQMAYNILGQVTQVAKPFQVATFNDPGSPSFTKTDYDVFNRLFHVTDDLGLIDASGASKTTVVTMTYSGSSVQTSRIVNGQTETRIEDKNVMGKVAQVTDANNAVISYLYNPDGNLISTIDPGGNSVQAIYDSRGRKLSTTDPDLGTWTYVFDGFGDLLTQTDAKAQVTTMSYDVLGRMVSKTDSTGSAQWVYDVGPGAGIGKLAAMVGAPDANLAGPCTIPFVTATDGNRAGKSYTYTPFGDLLATSECADGNTFTTSYEYDAFDRQSLIRYPAVRGSQLAVGYHYTRLGFLQYLTDESVDYSVLWQAKSMNALGQVTDEQMRNGVETVANRNPVTGWLLGSMSTAHDDGNTVIQKWGYTYDEIGNLLTRGRSDAVNDASSTEAFRYDLLNRLTSSEVTIAASGTVGASDTTDSFAYDGLGNLSEKDGKSYSYSSGCLAGGRRAGPHAVCTVAGGADFVYDGNGNMTTSGSRTVRYNPANKVIQVDSDPSPSQGNDTGSVQFMYGGDGNRVVQSVTSGNITSRTVYVGLGATGKSLYERTTTATTTGTTTQHVNFIYAGGAHGGNAFALRVLADDGSVAANKYYNFDHLGSVTAMSDDIGHVASASAAGADAGVLGYDAWGARRNPDGQSAPPASFNLQAGHREFTGHETIPDVGLINMNGRVYDPVIGRFLSPDPTVQDVSDLQSYNRYSYVVNNPLRYTDPTGYHLFGINWESASLWAGVGEALLGGVVCAASGGVGCAVYGLFVTLTNLSIAAGGGAGRGELGQMLAISAVGFVVGLATGGIASSIGGTGFWSAVVSGAISGAASTAMTSVMAGQGLGWNVALGAVVGAGAAGVTWGVQQYVPVTKASAQAAQGGGGSGAARVEKAETVESVLADGGYTGGDPIDRALWDDGDVGEPPNPDGTKQQLEDRLASNDRMSARYAKFGPQASTVDQLEDMVRGDITRDGGTATVAGTTDSSGSTETAYDPNQYRRQSTQLHEDVHANTTATGIAMYGRGTPEFNNWYYNPQNWAADEVAAYAASGTYLRTVIPSVEDGM
jgi:RHS repeat-associated protein